ncbi:hypothetical protein ALQ17_05358 [Pseudomonas fluorescens]|nr:hypothetical protein ALQ17_05358 [Pseudomonas fluorescens]
MNLVIHRHDAARRVAQPQRAPDAVIHPLNTPQKIPGNAQAVVIRVADRCQHTVAEVVETRCLRQHQFIGQSTQIDRRFGQAVGDRRPSSRRQGQGGRPILMIGPHHRIPGNTQPMRQRVAPAKPQPAIHFHRTGAVQPGPLKRQNPVQRSIGEGQQFLASDHRHRAAVGGGLVRRCRCIPSRILRNSRRVIHMFLLNQHGSLGLAAHRRHRVGNHLIPSLQRRIRNHPDRRRCATQQHRPGRLDMRFQPRPDHLVRQHLQPFTHALGLDMPQHLHTQTKLNPHAPRGPDQKQIDQHLAGYLTQQLVHLRRRQHAYPGNHGRQIDKQQRLIAEHKQALGNGVLAQFQQFIQFALGDVLQQLQAVTLEVRQQLGQLCEIVPKVVERLADPG